ncbi:MAG: protein kinase domain-containing protein [Pyrinomonadaceae bacterium]
MKQVAPNTMIQSRYLVVQAIGKGGMGEVYLAVDQRLGSAVALKRTKFDSDSALGNAFEREARILARLRHPVLPKVIDHFIDGEGQFLVMEHISGDDIEKRLSTANKPFPLSWVMFWADQLLDALNYLHSHEPPIIHRDIKPQNLKLTEDNHIILLDFGLSKDFKTGSQEAPAAGSVVGYSPHFAAMEQVRGTGTDARSDLYSLSATLYQLLSNTVPPDALTRAEAILGGQADPLTPLEQLNREVTKPISDVILRGMAVRQDHRWATAVEMQKALRRAFNTPQAEVDAAKTMVMDTPVITESLPAKTEPLPSTESMPTVDRIHNAAPPADATMRMDAPPANLTAEPLGAKTEVLPSPVTTPQGVIDQAPEPEQTPPTPFAAAAGAGGSAAAQPPIGNGQPPVRTPTQPRKGSKAPFILGALVGLIILAGAAGGGGWYYYNNFYKAKAVPSPSPDVNIAATPVPTINVVDASTPEPANTNTPAPSPTPEKEMTATAPSTKATPQSVAKTTDANKPAKPPVTKPTPKKDDRTVIMQ